MTQLEKLNTILSSENNEFESRLLELENKLTIADLDSYSYEELNSIKTNIEELINTQIENINKIEETNNNLKKETELSELFINNAINFCIRKIKESSSTGDGTTTLISDINSSIDALNTKIEKNYNDIIDNKSTIDSSISNLKTTSEIVEDNKDNISDNLNKIKDNINNIDNNKDSINTNRINIEINTRDIALNKENSDNNKDDIEDNKINIDINLSDINNINVEALTATIEEKIRNLNDLATSTSSGISYNPLFDEDDNLNDNIKG